MTGLGSTGKQKYCHTRVPCPIKCWGVHGVNRMLMFLYIAKRLYINIGRLLNNKSKF